jgi:uncharacterized membrane protein
MMRLVQLAAFLVVAFAAHAATVWALPRIVMNTAMSRLEATAGGPNRPLRAPPVDETSRRVVRPAPDLIYTACVIDSGDGPVTVTAAAWSGYTSVSLFAGNTDNVAVFNGPWPEKGTATFEVGTGEMDLPGERGIVLIRRIAGTEAMQADALAAQENDDCGSAE